MLRSECTSHTSYITWKSRSQKPIIRALQIVYLRLNFPLFGYGFAVFCKH